MRIAEVKVYTFDELVGKARERAIEDARRHLSETFDGDGLTDYFRRELEKEGLPTEHVHWRLSSCQGDGVGFYGKVDAEKFVTFHKLKNKIPRPLASGITFYSAFSFQIDNVNHHYHHWNSGRTAINWDDYDENDCPYRWREVAEWLRDQIQNRYVSMSRKLESDGYEEIDYATSDEYIIEFIGANDFEYEESGRPF